MCKSRRAVSARARTLKIGLEKAAPYVRCGIPCFVYEDVQRPFDLTTQIDCPVGKFLKHFPREPLGGLAACRQVLHIGRLSRREQSYVVAILRIGSFWGVPVGPRDEKAPCWKSSRNQQSPYCDRLHRLPPLVLIIQRHQLHVELGAQSEPRTPAYPSRSSSFAQRVRDRFYGVALPVCANARTLHEFGF